MANKTTQSKAFKKAFRNVKKLATQKTVQLEVQKGNVGVGLINAIIGQAKAGLGPNQSQYKGYSEAYGKHKAAAGQKGVPFWLRGIGNTGREGGMLDPKNFKYELKGDKLFLVWRPSPGSKQGDYAAVHNDGDAKTPQRKWMHVQSKAAAAAVLRVYQTVFKKLVAKILAGGNL